MQTLKRLVGAYPKYGDFLSRSAGYSAFAKDASHLSITIDRVTHEALCPFCYENALIWDNCLPLPYTKCVACNTVFLSDDMLVGENQTMGR